MKLNAVNKTLLLPCNYKIKNQNQFKQISKQKKYLPLSVRQERPKAIAWLIREYGKVLTDTQIAKLTSSTKSTVANIRAGNQSQPITEFRNPMDLGLCSYEDLEALVEKGQRKAEKEKKAKEKEKAAQLSPTTIS